MNLRGTLALLLIAAGLGLYVWLVEIRGQAAQEAAEAAERQLLSIAPDDVASLELPTSDAARARLVRADDGWRLESPIAFPANPSAVDSALEALESFDSTTALESPGTPEVYGLDGAARRVDVTLRDGTSRSIFLGEKAPVGNLRYVALESPPQRIYTVAESATGWLMPTLFNLRDKRLLRFDADAVSALRILSDGSLVAAAERVVFDEAEDEHDGERWQLSAPVADSASASRIDRLLADLSLARASGFVDAPEAGRTYGLDAPDAEIELITPQGTERLVMAEADGETWARVDGVDTIFEVPERLLSSVPRDPFELRDKQVLNLAEDDVRRVRLSFPRDDAVRAFVREGDTWRPEGHDERPRPLEIEDLLYAIESLEARDVVDGEADLKALGLDPPRVRVSAGGAEGEELGWLELGDPDPDRGIAARSSRGERVWRVSSELGRDVPLGLEAFRNLFLEPPEKPAGAEEAADTAD